MSDCTHLHETIIKDVLDIWDDIKKTDLENLPKQRERGSFSSIARGTQNLVLTFPVACSTALTVQSAAMISKAIERKCVGMVQMLLASFQVTDTDNIQDFLAQFHTNLSTRNFSVDDFLSLTDAAVELPGVEVNREQYEAIKADMRNLDYALRGPIAAAPLSEYSVMEMGGQTMVMRESRKNGNKHFRQPGVPPIDPGIIAGAPDVEDQILVNRNTFARLRAREDEADRIEDELNATKAALAQKNADYDQSVSAISGYQAQLDSLKNQLVGSQLHNTSNKQERDRALADLDALKADFADFSQKSKAEQEKIKANYNAKLADIESKFHLNNMKTAQQSADYFNKMVIGNELKKANELMPSLLAVNFTYKNSQGDPVHIRDVVIGVKAKLYVIDSFDMMDHLATKTQDANWVTQLLRATTREISFIKDFILMLDRAKIDALSTSRRGSSNKMWKVLERRALKSRMKRAFGRNNNAAAITTMVMSQEEVDFMKKNFHVDLMNPNVANKILDGYNLMGFVVVDETIEVAKFLFDTGEDMWESVAFTHLEREAGDSTYKKVINMMAKVVR